MLTPGRKGIYIVYTSHFLPGLKGKDPGGHKISSRQDLLTGNTQEYKENNTGIHNSMSIRGQDMTGCYILHSIQVEKHITTKSILCPNFRTDVFFLN